VKNNLGIADRRTAACNSTYNNLAAQWLNGALCIVLTSVVAGSLVLRNRQLLLAANHYTTSRFNSF